MKLISQNNFINLYNDDLRNSFKYKYFYLNTKIKKSNIACFNTISNHVFQNIKIDKNIKLITKGENAVFIKEYNPGKILHYIVKVKTEYIEFIFTIEDKQVNFIKKYTTKRKLGPFELLGSKINTKIYFKGLIRLINKNIAN